MTPAEIKEAEREGMHEWGKSLPDRPFTGLMSEINRAPRLTPDQSISATTCHDPERHIHIPLKNINGHVTWTGQEPPSDEFMEAMESLANAAAKAIELGILPKEEK